MSFWVEGGTSRWMQGTRIIAMDIGLGGSTFSG